MSGWEREIAFLAFTDRGAALAERLRAALGGTVTAAHGDGAFSLAAWTAEVFAARRPLVFVGAVGIAVRAIAPHLRGKAVDPPVTAVDERGRFAVAVASGHLGGGNDLTRAVAAACGAVAVITTATDLGGRFAVDEWARRQNCAVPRPGGIKQVSAKILAGETVRIRSAWPVAGTPPQQVVWGGPDADVAVDLYRRAGETALPLVPRILVLGVGCRRGTPREALEAAFSALCGRLGLWEEAVCRAASIDCKAEEPGLLAFCAARGWPLDTFPAEALRRAEGRFAASAFVERTVGVDNVCERSAVLAAGGPLLEGKAAGGGVTLALARRPYEMDWRWQDA